MATVQETRTEWFVKAVRGEIENRPVSLAESKGAAAHASAVAYDSGKTFVLTGRDAHNKPLRREAKSFLGAYAILRAAWGYTRVWQTWPVYGRDAHGNMVVTKTAKRLVFERAAAN